MNADLMLRELLGKSAEDSLDDLSENEIVDLAVKFAIWPATESYVSAPWLARFALRRQRHRIDDRAPGEKRDLWAMPDESGFFADDNSLLKSTFKNREISGGNNPYGMNQITAGLVCCHIWPTTTGDPLLFSFLPNLVWLPKSLSKFTDVFRDKPVHKVHLILQEIAYRRYKSLTVSVGVDDDQKAWIRLPRPTINIASEPMLNEMNSEPFLSNLVRLRHTRLLSFLDAALSDSNIQHLRFSKRYHLGFGSGIDKTVPSISSLVSKVKILELREIVASTAPISIAND